LFVAWRLLQAREAHRELFNHGAYVPLIVRGALAEHVVAFARATETDWAIVVVPRLVQKLIDKRPPHSSDPPLAGVDWADTAIELPSEAGEHFANVFHQESMTAESSEDGAPRTIAIRQLFTALPVALLVSDSNIRSDIE
jgi:(1->4)-alpha-D-glucan 1-alpha-D-glucosylmutase